MPDKKKKRKDAKNSGDNNDLSKFSDMKVEMPVNRFWRSETIFSRSLTEKEKISLKQNKAILANLILKKDDEVRIYTIREPHIHGNDEIPEDIKKRVLKDE